MARRNFYAVGFLLLALTGISLSQSDLPIGLQRIIAANMAFATDFLSNISFPIAFLAGVLSFLSPCILPILPPYFAYTFKERRNITKMTLVFSLGFTTVFVFLGLLAGFLGEQALSTIPNRSTLALFAGIFIILFGIMVLFGKGFSGLLKLPMKSKNDVLGTFLLGVFFALGWSACLGPILAGILSIGAILNNFLYSGALLFVYSLGIFLPFFILSVFFDRLDFSKYAQTFSKGFTFKFLGKETKILFVNLVSAILLIITGLVFVVYRGTTIVNAIDPFRTTIYFYTFQDKLMGSNVADLLGGILLSIFVIIMYSILVRLKK